METNVEKLPGKNVFCMVREPMKSYLCPELLTNAACGKGLCIQVHDPEVFTLTWLSGDSCAEKSSQSCINPLPAA